MAKVESITDRLLSLLPADQQAAVKARPEFAGLQAEDKEATDLRSIYHGDEEPEVPATPPATPPAAAATTTAATAATGDESVVLRSIKELQVSVKGQFDDFKTKVITKDDLPKLRNQFMTDAIKAADDYATVRETHFQEFGEKLDRGVFEKFVADQNAAGVQFASMKDAHDKFVGDKRTKAAIDKGIKDGLKQKNSGEQAPGQSDTAGTMSPAQSVMANARKTADGGGKSNAQRAAEAMAAVRRQREEGGAGTLAS